MISRFRHEPREVPSGFLARFTDDVRQYAAVFLSGYLMSGFLICIRFALVPEQCAKVMRSQFVNTRHHPVTQSAITFPNSRLDPRDELGLGRRNGKPSSFRQPLPYAGGSVPG